jgi:hypothetical protein
VHVVPVRKPVKVVTNGVDSEAEPEAGDGVPLVQLTLTATLAPSFGTKSLLTVKVPLFRLFVIVQLAPPPLMIMTDAQFAWFAV